MDGSQPRTPSRVGKASSPGALSKFNNSFLIKSRKNRKLKSSLMQSVQAQNCDCPFYQFNGVLKAPQNILMSDNMAPRQVVQQTKKQSNKQNLNQIEMTPPTILEKDIADEAELNVPVRVQYKIYLFQRILLCCKEINPNKPKNKMLGTNKPLTDKKGKLRLQLKGRIFMQNVTDVVSVKNGKDMAVIKLRPMLIIQRQTTLHHTDFLERRSRSRELCDPIHHRRAYDQVARSSINAETGTEQLQSKLGTNSDIR